MKIKGPGVCKGNLPGLNAVTHGGTIWQYPICARVVGSDKLGCGKRASVATRNAAFGLVQAIGYPTVRAGIRPIGNRRRQSASAVP